MPSLSLVAGKAAAVKRSPSLDLALLTDAPSLVRWRTRCASLAYNLGLFYVAGGRPTGNVVAAGHRLSVKETWASGGAVFARLLLGEASLVVAIGSAEGDIAWSGSLHLSSSVVATSQFSADGVLTAELTF